MPIRERLQIDLRTAMKNRDRVAISVLRSTLASIANAEAVAVTTKPGGFSEAPLGPAGLSVDVPRRHLYPDEIAAVILADAQERRAALSDYEQHGHDSAADRMREELAVLARYLEPADPA